VRPRLAAAWLLIGAACAGCSLDASGTGDAPFAASVDAPSAVDSADASRELVDSTGADGRAEDAGPVDSGAVDSAAGDTWPDLGLPDAASLDGGFDTGIDAAETASDTGNDTGVDAGIDTGADAADTAGDAGPEAGAVVGASSVASDSLSVDRVRGSDGAIASDGTKDGAFLVTLEGPIVALALISTDAAGAPSGAQEWDTYVGTKAVPAGIGAGYTAGSQTWQLGVWEGATLLNKADGSLGPVAAGPHSLHLYAQPSGWFVAGKHLRVVAELPDGTIAKGPVVTY
jgi:hypothetical protein